LINKKDTPIPQNAEGPTAITIQLFKNTLDKQTLIGWLTGSSDSNYKLSNGTYASTTIKGIPAVSYATTGLYENKNTAFIYGDTIVMISVSYLSPQDQIIKDYTDLLSSFQMSR
jgi:hypothetical protein